MWKKLLSNPGSLSWGLLKTRFALIDFSSEIEDTPWAELDTRLFGSKTGPAAHALGFGDCT